jgi:DNA ligase-1
MPDLAEGQTLEVQGSAARPYVLKNVAGVYSCSCPSWRNQSLPISARSCKHLRQFRGDGAEQARLGSSLPILRPSTSKPKAPPLLLAEAWDGVTNPCGWWLSEKLDGVRAYWDGRIFLSRGGNRFHAPAWFTQGLPLEPLDGELWIGRKRFQRTVSIVRRHDATDLWNEVRFRVFDAPAHDGDFESRLEMVHLVMQLQRPPFAQAHPHRLCEGISHLQRALDSVESEGGEGLMLRRSRSLYEAGRSQTLLKVKTFHESEAEVTGYEAGAGRHQGRLRALLVKLPNGTRFCVGTGFTDAERSKPPVIGTIITFRYQELSDGGVPRFPSFVRVRADFEPNHEKGGTTLSNQAQTTRRFEFVGGGSDKFWEIRVDGTQVNVRFGRNGASGKATSKSFADAGAASKHAEKLIREKTGKGYTEVREAA